MFPKKEEKKEKREERKEKRIRLKKDLDLFKKIL